MSRPAAIRQNETRSCALRKGGRYWAFFPKLSFNKVPFDLETGDVLVLYSDGLVEAANSQDEEFGEERVSAIVREHRRDTAEEIRDRILSSVQAFTGRTVPEDDRTLFVIVYSGAPDWNTVSCPPIRRRPFSSHGRLTPGDVLPGITTTTLDFASSHLVAASR